MLDPIVLRWCIAIVVLSLVPVLASGWRYHGRPRLPITLGVGLFSGVSAGAVLIAGPPVILYWLGGGSAAKTVRANLMVFFMICDVLLVAIFGYASLFEARPLALSVLLGIPYLARHGRRLALFHGTSDGSTAASPTPSSRSRRWSACRCSTRSCADATAHMLRSDAARLLVIRAP